MGIVVQHEKGRWSLYQSQSYEGIKALLTERKQTLNRQISDLELVKSDFSKLQINDHSFTNLQYYKWIHAVSLIYTKLAQSKSLRAVYNPSKSLEYSFYSTEELSHILIDNKIESKEILTDSAISKQYANNLNWHTQHQVKFLAESKMETFHADHLITDNTFYFIAFADEIIWVEITNPIFVEAQKVIFDQLRDSIK